MANSASAKKRARQNDRNRDRNRARKSVLKGETRKFLEAVQHGELQVAKDALVSVQKRIDQTAAKGTLHKNTASRQKSRLAKRLNAAVKAGK